ncbi:MAG: hypothetical protein FWG64_09955 [Firmicutes bacterium]|nr:hypothetical protein [Bacillota bacterium]
MGINLTNTDGAIATMETAPHEGVFINKERLPGVTDYKIESCTEHTLLTIKLIVNKYCYDDRYKIFGAVLE